MAITPQFKFTGGWRFNDRQIKLNDDPTMTWHQNWMLLGAVIQPSRAVRLNVNYDFMSSHSSNSTTTPSDTYTREAPNKIHDIRARVQAKPKDWIDFGGKRQRFHRRQRRPAGEPQGAQRWVSSFTTHVTPAASMNLELDYAYQNIYSSTDLYTATPTPIGANTAGTCAPTPRAEIHLGNGLYKAPSNYFNGIFHYTAPKYVVVGAGIRVNSVNGVAGDAQPLPGAGRAAVDSTGLHFADLVIHIAPQWSWHGDWNRPDYAESGPAGPAPRDFNGNIFTLGVKHEF